MIRELQRINSFERRVVTYETTSSAGGDDCVLPVFLAKSVSCGRHKTNTGRPEWMTKRQRTSPQVELVHGWRSKLKRRRHDLHQQPVTFQSRRIHHEQHDIPNLVLLYNLQRMSIPFSLCKSNPSLKLSDWPKFDPEKQRKWCKLSWLQDVTSLFNGRDLPQRLRDIRRRKCRSWSNQLSSESLVWRKQVCNQGRADCLNKHDDNSFHLLTPITARLSGLVRRTWSRGGRQAVCNPSPEPFLPSSTNTQTHRQSTVDTNTKMFQRTTH